MGKLTMEFYLSGLQRRYARGDKKTKSQILDEFCAISGQYRKHAIRVLGCCQVGKSRKQSGRKKDYTPELLSETLKQIWLLTDQMCGKRLKVALPLWVPHFENNYGPLEAVIKRKSLVMSADTIDRLFSRTAVIFPKGSVEPNQEAYFDSKFPLKRSME